jgi:ribosomal-protein-alanine N-acetyltransferase
MQAADIPQILDIERQSFPTMWPQTIYQREMKNKMARYLVAYEPSPKDTGLAPAREHPDAPGMRRFVQRFIGGLPDASGTNDRILGVVGLWLMVGDAHIVTIAVRPECRRQGIGEVLLVAAIETAIRERQDEVTLEYRISNEGARAMYEKYGFRQAGVRAKYYSDTQEDAVLMTTPELRSHAYRQLLIERIAEQRKRWGNTYPLAGELRAIVR